MQRYLELRNNAISTHISIIAPITKVLSQKIFQVRIKIPSGRNGNEGGRKALVCRLRKTEHYKALAVPLRTPHKNLQLTLTCSVVAEQQRQYIKQHQ